MTETLAYWQKMAGNIKPQTMAFINGKYVHALSGKKFDSINPATDAVIAQVAECDKEDIDLAVKAARKAFDGGAWSQASVNERKQVLGKLADLIDQHHHELALLDTLDMGKAIAYSFNDDVPLASAHFRYFAEAIDKVYDEVAPLPRGSLGMIRREALGVVGAVVPWNYPLLMAVWKIAPALATGNSVVLKPAEQSPLSVLLLAKLASEAGLPDGVLNVVPGYGETCGKALGLHNDVDCLAFTGSTEVGKYFLQYSGQSNMKQVWLECGGKSPNIIFADCDLEQAADNAARGIWYNQGEVCSANSRLIVEHSIKDKFVDMLLQRRTEYMPKNPLDPESKMGPLVDRTQLKRVLNYIDIGHKCGKLVAGGKASPIDGKGCYVEPTIFDGVNNSSQIAQEEIFGPVLAVMSFKKDEEAIAMANDSIYGLAGSVWTSSLSRAHHFADKMRVGSVSVNNVDAGDVTLPFGGFKQSGFGRDLSLHALEKYSSLKTIWISY